MADTDKPPRSKPPVSLEKWLGRLRKVERDGGAVVQNHTQALRASQTREAELGEKLKLLTRQLQEAQLELQNQRDRPVAAGALANHDSDAAAKEEERSRDEITRLKGLVLGKNKRLNERLRKLREAREELARKEEDLGMLGGGFQELNAKYLALKGMVDAPKFVSVLIDEDSMRFRDDLVRAGEQGGTEAAHALRHTALNYLKTLGAPPVSSPPPSLVVSIFRSKLASPSDETHDTRKHMTPFKRGFNAVDPSFNFVVTGTPEDLTLLKLRALFEMHVHDVRCAHVVLGGASDAFHKALLQCAALYPYGKETLPVRRRVTLVRVARGPNWRVDLSRKFKVLRAEGVFQDV